MRLDGLNGVYIASQTALDDAIEKLCDEACQSPELKDTSSEVLAVLIMAGISRAAQEMTYMNVKTYIDHSRGHDGNR